MSERLAGNRETAFGELLRELRQKLFGEGHAGVLGLLGFGDADWVFGGDMLTLEMLPAGCGDCLWLEVGEPGNTRIVLIDGGVKATAGFLVERIRAALAERRAARLKIDLLIITHYDNDHIEGILELLEKYQTWSVSATSGSTAIISS